MISRTSISASKTQTANMAASQLSAAPVTAPRSSASRCKRTAKRNRLGMLCVAGVLWCIAVAVEAANTNFATSFGNDMPAINFGTTNDAAWLANDPNGFSTGTKLGMSNALTRTALLYSNGAPCRVFIKPPNVTATATDENSVVLNWDSFTGSLYFSANRLATTSPKCMAVMWVNGGTASVIALRYVGGTGWRQYKVDLTGYHLIATAPVEVIIGWMPCTGTDTNGNWKLDNLYMISGQ